LASFIVILTPYHGAEPQELGKHKGMGQDPQETQEQQWKQPLTQPQWAPLPVSVAYE